MTCIVWDGEMMVVDRALPRFSTDKGVCQYTEIGATYSGQHKTIKHWPRLRNDGKVYEVFASRDPSSELLYYFTGVGWRTYIESFWVFYAHNYGVGGELSDDDNVRRKVLDSMREKVYHTTGGVFVVLNCNGLLYFDHAIPGSGTNGFRMVNPSYELCDIYPNRVGRSKCILGVGADGFGYGMLEAGHNAIDVFQAIMYRSYISSDEDFDVYGADAYDVYLIPSDRG